MRESSMRGLPERLNKCSLSTLCQQRKAKMKVSKRSGPSCPSNNSYFFQNFIILPVAQAVPKTRRIVQTLLS